VSAVGGSSKLRLSVKRREGHLLKGYGPLAALLVAFVLMAWLVPTVAPTQDVVHETQLKTVTSAGGATGSSTTGSGATTGASTSGATGAAGTGGATGATGSSGSAVRTAGAIASAPAKGKVSACPNGQTQQVPGDPYSPPCMVFSGSNGGATSPGVSASTITLSYRFTADSTSFQQTLASLGGASITETNADTERTIQALVAYFNSHYQFYGRKIAVDFFNGQGSETNELQGEGQQAADADAVTVAQSMHAFGELNGTTEPYDVALAAQHVMSFGAPYLSSTFMGQYAPYMWSIDTESDQVVQAGTEFVLKSLAGGDAQYAGGSLQGQKRKFALIAPSNPYYQSAATSAVQEYAAAGYPVTDDISYQLNFNTISSQAASIISKLQADGDTTVVCGCDPITLIFLTARAAEQGYTPEWVEVGVVEDDQDIVAQLFDQSEWSHAFGITFAGPIEPEQDTFGYTAYKQEDPSTEPGVEVDIFYEQLLEIAIGIQMAGPDLTPQTFEQGMRNYPGSQAGASNALYGTWDFPPGHYTPQMDSAIIYWNPNKISTYNDKQGAYVLASPRYLPGQYPSGPAPLPSSFPITPNSSSSSSG
jgi:hypothetical protein